MPADSLPSPKPGAIPSKPYERRQSKTLTDTDGYKKLMHDARSAESRVRSSYEMPALPSRPASSLSTAKTPPLDALPFTLEKGDNMHIDHFGIVRKRPPRHRSLSSGSVADSLEGPELRLPRRGKGRATSRDLSAIPEDPSAKPDPDQPESDSDSHRSITPTSPAFPLQDATFTPFDNRLQSPPALSRLRHQSIGPIPAPTPLPHPAVLSARGSEDPAPATPPSPSTPFVFPRAFSPTAVPVFKVRDLSKSADRPYQDEGKLLYASTRTDVDLHHNSMAMGVNSLLSSQDAIWNALQVNLDMSRHVLGSVAAHSDVLAPQGNLIKGLVQIQENLVTYVGQSHDSLATYLSAAHAHLANSIRDVMDDMNVDPPPPPPDHSDAIATLTQRLTELERGISKKLDRIVDTVTSNPRSDSHPSSSSPRDMDRITQMILDLSKNLNMKIDQRFDALEHRFLAKQTTPQGLSTVPQVQVSPAAPSRPSTPGPAPIRPTTPSAATPTVAIKTPKPPCEALSQVQIRTELEKGKPSTTRKKHLKARLTLIESASTTEQFALVAPKPWTSAFHTDASEWFSEQDWAGTDRICLGTEEECHFATLGQAARANAKVNKSPPAATQPNTVSSATISAPPTTTVTPSQVIQTLAASLGPVESAAPPRKNVWWLRFLQEIPPEARLSSVTMLKELQSRLPNDAYPVKPLSITWWPQREGARVASIRLEFTMDTPESNILTQANVMVNLLSHTVPTSRIIFHKAGPSTKMLLHSVRCREKHNDPLIPLTTIISQLSLDFPTFARLKFVQVPVWVGEDASTPEKDSDSEDIPLPVPKLHRSVFINFEDDEEKSLGRDLKHTRLFYLGDLIKTAFSATKPEIVQCSECWLLMADGNMARHQNTPGRCSPKCRFCGSPDHISSVHYQFCRPCVADNHTSSYECTHLKCPNCNADDHDATYDQCPSRIQFIAETEQRIALIQAGNWGGKGGSKGGVTRGRGRGSHNQATSSRGGKTVRF